MLQDDVQETDTEYRDTYTEVATNCIRYLDLTIDEIDRLTIPDYVLLMKATELKEVDRSRDRHILAWLTVSAGATKKDGKPVYKKFKDFFDYDSELKRLDKKPNDKFSQLSKHLKEKRNATGSKSNTDSRR